MLLFLSCYSCAEYSNYVDGIRGHCGKSCDAPEISSPNAERMSTANLGSMKKLGSDKKSTSILAIRNRSVLSQRQRSIDSVKIDAPVTVNSLIKIEKNPEASEESEMSFDSHNFGSKITIDRPITSNSFLGNPSVVPGKKIQFKGNIDKTIDSFLAKIGELDVERGARQNLPETVSLSYIDIIKFLYNSYMGEFDFSSVRFQEVAVKQNGFVVMGQSDNLLPSILGAKWLLSGWCSIKDSENEFHMQVKAALSRAAPKTMNSLPSLAPKKIAERDVLEGWLVDGLLAAYPTILRLDLTKNDAISLILLVILSKNYQESENLPTIHQIFGELQKYDVETAFPLEKFEKFILESGKDVFTKTLFKIIEKQDLNFASHVVKTIISR